MSSSLEAAPRSRAAAPAPLPTIVKHPGCPQWGLGMLVEERDEKRIYDFEDGLSHSIAKAFWSKIEPVELAADEARALEAKIKAQRVKLEPSRKPRVRTVAPPSMTFDEQVARFEALFPGGFTGDAFTNDERGGLGEPPPLSVAAPSVTNPETGEVEAPPSTVAPTSTVAPRSKKAKAQSRSQAIATAKAELDKAELTKLVAAGNHAEVIARIKRVHQAAGNLLHPLGDLIPFSKLPEDHQAAVSESIVGVLYGAGELAPRFDKMVEALAADKLNTWPLSTVLLALLDPETHAFVKPSFYEKQAAIVGFDLGNERVPSAAAYARMQALSGEVERRLREKGHEPRDKMDVYAFIWRTTAPPKKEAPKKEKAPKAAPAPKADEG
jgi:hypothetical protein